MASLHKCRIEACPERIPRSQLMCRDHWFMVPAPLRAEVNAAYAAYRDGASIGPLLDAQEEAQKVVEQEIASD